MCPRTKCGQKAETQQKHVHFKIKTHYVCGCSLNVENVLKYIDKSQVSAVTKDKLMAYKC